MAAHRQPQSPGNVMAARKRSAKPKPKRASAKKPTAQTPLARERARLERNKQLVLAFYRQLIGNKDAAGARRFMGESYVQHSPYATDGHEGVAEFVKGFKTQFPRHHYDVKRVIAEGDYVVLHLHGQEGLFPHGEAVVDIFRVVDGKVVEHWDVIQALPERSRNSNTPF
jgi:predicted SnoaL-like aldol condensation-catalyzing enzyme